MKVVVIGGTGHIGSFLTPQLVEAGHEVTCISRGNSSPYVPDKLWEDVTMVQADRKAEDAEGTFGQRIAALKPDAVIDLVCFTPESNRALVEAVSEGGGLKAFLHCGTIWVHGPSAIVPTTEDLPRSPIGTYGKNKAAIEQELLEAAARVEFPATIVHPGHIVGPGWVPLNPQGNFNTNVFRTLFDGGELLLPYLGLEMLHHVHAADVAQLFLLALEKPEAARGQSFHAVSPAALTLRGFAEAVAGWAGREANLRFVPWDEFAASVGETDAEQTKSHIARSLCCSIEKGQRLLGYEPKYTSLDAVRESLRCMEQQ